MPIFDPTTYAVDSLGSTYDMVYALYTGLNVSCKINKSLSAKSTMILYIYTIYYILYTIYDILYL